ncbi:MAG: alpha/beta hydrolase, partial [Verrucomicrobiota bacterium]
GEIGCPVLWVTGGADEKFGVLAREVVGLLPRGEHVEIAGAGHRVPWESPSEFKEVVSAFQNRC